MDRSLTAALLRPRHVVVSLALFALLSAGGWGLVGLVTAADEAQAAEATLASFELALPRVGDHAVYEYRAAPGHEGRVGGIEGRQWEFWWAADEEAPDANGIPGPANHLVTIDRVAGEDRRRDLVVPAGQRGPTLWSTNQTSADQQPSHVLPTGTSSREVTWSTLYAMDERLSCWVRNPWQGVPGGLHDGAVLPADCQEVPNQPWTKDVHLRAVAAAGGLAQAELWWTLGFDDGSLQGPELGYSLVFAADNPYPVRIAMEAFSIDLVGFARGAQEMAKGGDADSSVPSLRQFPLDADGPDETGIEHIFPLSAAFAVVRDDPEQSDFRDYLAAHPAAVMVWARHASFDSVPEAVVRFPIERWSFGLWDGREAFEAGIERRMTVGPGGALPPEFVRVEPNHVYDDTTYPAMQDLPPALPAVADLLARWQPHSAGLEGNSWSFAFLDHANGALARQVTAGHVSYRDSGQATALVAYTGNWTTNELTLTPDGRFVRWDASGQSDRQAYLVDLEGAVPPVSPASTAPAETVSVPGPWSPPKAAVAVTVGASALAIALAYFLWPAVKGAFVGLFSRVEPEELLENPTRAMLVSAVEANPGIHHQELVRIARKGNGAAEHHLQKLVTAGLLARHKSAGYTCYFRAGKVDRRVMASAHLLKSPVARAIVEAAQRSPGTSLAQVARDAGVSVPTVHYHVQRLQGAGLVAWNGGLYPGASGTPAAASPAGS